jgi:hypothetical protein
VRRKVGLCNWRREVVPSNIVFLVLCNRPVEMAYCRHPHHKLRYCNRGSVTEEGGKVSKQWKANLQDAGLGRKVRMPQPQTVDGTIGNLDKDICKDNALGKAFYTMGRPSVRVSCQVE